MNISSLAGHARPDFNVFELLLEETAKLLDEFWECEQFNPFDDGELPSVSVLCSAAARAGFSPVAESRVLRVGSSSGGCRADLWFNHNDVSRAFEFKHWRNSHWGLPDLKKTLDYAMAGARTFPADFAHYFYAGVIAPIGRADSIAVTHFAKQCDLAFSTSDPAPLVFFLFNETHN